MLDIRFGYANICKRVAGHTHGEIFFWRRGISFRFGPFVFSFDGSPFLISVSGRPLLLFH